LIAPLRPGGSLRLWLKRVGWLIALWAASVAALGVAAMLMRLLMRAVGLR
jgi:hypothetical protein